MPSGGTLHIEEIQDQVELELMRSEEREVARAYVLYREERTKVRQEAEPQKEQAKTKEEPGIKITLDDGSESTLDIERLNRMVQEACEGLQDVSAAEIVEEAKRNLYDGVSMADIRTSLVMTARTLVEQEPNYTYVTARILLDNLRSEA